MPDSTDNFFKKIVESTKGQTEKDYANFFDKWVKSPSSKMYNYTAGMFNQDVTRDGSTQYFKKVITGEEGKEMTGSSAIAGIKSSIVGTGNIMKSSFNYISSWTYSMFGNSSIAATETKNAIDASKNVVDKLKPAVSYVTDLSKDAYGKAGSAFSASKDYIKEVDSEGTIRDGVKSKLDSTTSLLSEFSKDLYSKSGNILSLSKDYIKAVEADHDINSKIKSSYSYIKDYSIEAFRKTGSVLSDGKESLVKKSQDVICKGKKVVESSEKSLNIGGGSAAAVVLNEAIVENNSKQIIVNAVAGKPSSSSAIVRGFDYTKTLLGSAAYQVNQNKLLYSSIILASLLINETGARYSKTKANAQYNILSYQDMNKNVVLVLGSMLDPITKREVEDLLNRGFIVYVSSVDAKNSPFPEELLSAKENDAEALESSSNTILSKAARRRNSDILSDISSEDEEQSVDNGYQKISDSDWIVSSTQCFSNENATQEFTRLNYITNKLEDIKSLANLIKEKKWNLAAIVFSYDNVSNNFKASSNDFKEVILNNMMEMISTLVKSSQIWPKTKIILFNNSLSNINEITTLKKQKNTQEPSLQILCNNLVKTVYDTLTQSKHEKIYLINIGILKDDKGYALNYKDLSRKIRKNGGDIGSNLFKEFLNPIQNIIMDKTSTGIFYDMGSKNVISCGSLSVLNDYMKLLLNESFILKLILLSTQFIALFSSYKKSLKKNVAIKCNQVKEFVVNKKY